MSENMLQLNLKDMIMVLTVRWTLWEQWSGEFLYNHLHVNFKSNMHDFFHPILLVNLQTAD